MGHTHHTCETYWRATWNDLRVVSFIFCWCIVCYHDARFIPNCCWMSFFFFTVLDNKVSDLCVYVWFKFDNEMRQWIGRDIFYLIGNMISRNCFEMVEFTLHEKRNLLKRRILLLSSFSNEDLKKKKKREHNFHFWKISTEQKKITVYGRRMMCRPFSTPSKCKHRWTFIWK